MARSVTVEIVVAAPSPRSARNVAMGASSTGGLVDAASGLLTLLAQRISGISRNTWRRPSMMPTRRTPRINPFSGGLAMKARSIALDRIRTTKPARIRNTTMRTR